MASGFSQDPWYWSHETLRDALDDPAERCGDERLMLKLSLQNIGLDDIDSLRNMICELNTDGRSVLLLTKPAVSRLVPRESFWYLFALAEVLRPFSSQYQSSIQQLLCDGDAAAHAKRRVGETVVEGQDGKKRRRLAPTVVDTSTSEPRNIGNLVVTENAQMMPPDFDQDEEEDELEFCYLHRMDTRDPREQLEAYKAFRRDLALITEEMEIVSLPGPGEADSESEESENAENEMEEAEEEDEDHANFSSLLKEMEEHYRQQWRTKKQPSLEHRAHKIYFQDGKRRLRSERITWAKNWREHLEKRLSQVKAALLSGDSSSVDEFKRMCAGMETTISAIMEEDWKISLWQCDTAPAPAPRRSATSATKKVVPIQGQAVKQESKDKDAGEEDGFVVQDRETTSGYERRRKNPLLSSLRETPRHNRPENEFFNEHSNFSNHTPVQETPSLDYLEALENPVTLDDLRGRSDLHTTGISRFDPARIFGPTYKASSDQYHKTSASHKVSDNSCEAGGDAMDISDVDISDGEPLNNSATVAIEDDNDSGNASNSNESEALPTEIKAVKQQIKRHSPSASVGKSEIPEVIVLSSSPPATPVRKPPIPAVMTTLPSKDPTEWKLNPLEAPPREICGWPWSKLESGNDARRTVLKVVFTILTKPERTSIWNFLTNHSKTKIDGQVRSVYEMLGDPQKCSEPQLATEAFFRLAKLYACWFDTTHLYIAGDPVPDHTLREISAAELYDPNADFDQFKSFTQKALAKFERLEGLGSPPVHTASNAPVIDLRSEEDDDDDEEADEEYDEVEDDLRASQSKRKRKITQNSRAKDMQNSAQKRAEQAEQARKTVLKIRVPPKSQSSELDQGPSEFVINPGKVQGQDDIFINSHVGHWLKEHQLEGIQFMWREIVAANSDDSTMEGCLLAHVMGLGKTLQAITLLVTIAEAASSDNSRIFNQIPRSLRVSRTLVLCPAGLLQNWAKEFEKWTPIRSKEVLGPVRGVDSAMTLERRLDHIFHWHTTGGVLLLGYEMFRSLIAVRNEQVPNDYKEYLLNGPNIIIADEAHILRNQSSTINRVVHRFRSKSRIALTGSPLNNNLDEIYAMVHWIVPDYLGSREDFISRFSAPIQDGGYVDSSITDRRRSQQKLKLLMRSIGPKVDRKDIMVLKDDLSPKNEFVLKVPLTEFQKESYSMLMDSLLAKKTSQTSNMRILEWLLVLSLLCNHPRSFEIKLSEKKEDTKNPKKVKNEPIRPRKDDADLSEHVSALGIDDLDVRQQEKLFNQRIPPEDRALPELSHKTELLVNILDLSKQAQEQVMVFSQHLPTLDFLKRLCEKREDRFTVIEGKVAASERFTRCEQFNEGKFNIILISSRAGSLGHNLTGGSRVVVFDFGFNPMWEDQAVSRAYRIGQTRPVYVYRFVAAGTFEDAMYNRTVYKKQLASRVVDRKNVSAAAHRAGDFLFAPREAPQKNLDAYRGKDPLVLDRLLALPDSPIRDIVAMETLAIEEEGILTEEDLREVEEQFRAEASVKKKWEEERALKKLKITEEEEETRRRRLEYEAQRREAAQHPPVQESSDSSSSSSESSSIPDDVLTLKRVMQRQRQQ